MENALVIGASGGIGQALCKALAARGVSVTPLSRSRDGLDVTDEQSVETVLGGLDGPYDLVFVATGALEINGHAPEKALRQVSAPGFMEQFAVNAMGPALIMKHAARLLPRDRLAVFAALSARVGSIGDNRRGGWYAYRMAKAALNQFVHGAAIELARSHRQSICVALHPGTVETPLTAKYAGNHPTVTPDQAARHLLGVIDGLTPAETGLFFDWAGKRVEW
ncbi:SDR family NAD(P)-dependent oxidoreductase [Rhodovulum sp. YNF3179]|uniref:SDR family NAD(P)-dependent oxidoreductase n=1 Tax=Rhodovulum sp. YNF3179 TaxID=3425127 RepID=UPI003D3325BE